MTLNNEIHNMLVVIDLGAFNSWNITYESHQSKCFIPTKSFAPTNQQLITKECHPSSIKLALFQFGCHDSHGNLVTVFLICLTDCVKSFHNFGVQITEIWQIVSFFIMKWSTMTSRILLFSILWWHWGKRYFRFLSEIWTLELHIPRTAWRIFSWWYMYHSFSIFTVLSSKRNLYFACSSVLRFALHSICGGHGFESEWNLQMNLAKVSWCKENACLQLCLKRLAKSVPNMQCKKIIQTGKI